MVSDCGQQPFQTTTFQNESPRCANARSLILPTALCCRLWRGFWKSKLPLLTSGLMLRLQFEAFTSNAALRQRHHLVTVDLMARPSSGTHQGLLRGELDVGVMLGNPVDAGLTYHQLTTVQYRVAGPIAWKEQIDAADWPTLSALPWLTPSASSAHSTMLAQLFKDRGLELNSVIRFDHSAVGRAALEAGAGMMLLRADRAMQGEREGFLAVSPIAEAEIALSIAHQSGRIDDPLIRAFLEAARTPWPEMKPAFVPGSKRPTTKATSA